MSSESVAVRAETVTRSIDWITGFHEVRPVDSQYVERLRKKIREIGVKPYPLSVTPDGVLFGGRHRYEAFKAEGVTECLVHIHQPDDLDREAIELNRASEDVLPMTFVDYAELVWRRLEGRTQQQVADGLGWSREKIAQYAQLRKVCAEAWAVVTDSARSDALQPDDGATEDVTSVTPFTEGLLRNILDLAPNQQLALCKALAKGKGEKGRPFGKADFKAKAQWYRAANALQDAAIQRLSKAVPGKKEKDGKVVFEPPLSDYLDDADLAIYKDGNEYVAEYLKLKKPGEKFAKLIDSLIDDYQQKSNIRIIVKDIRLLTDDDIEGESVDVIITDPPYPAEHVDLFDELGRLAEFALKPGGSLIAMTGQAYLPRYLELLGKHLSYHWTLAYLTPGGQAAQLWNQEVNTFWKPLLWFVKGDRDGRWVSDVIKTPVNANDKQHHHWGQGLHGILEIVKKFSNPGDVVLDPFLGGGTTGAACKALNRKFIGVEIDPDTASNAIARIEETNRETD